MNIALIGTGTIGSGVVEIIEKNSDLIQKRTGIRLDIKKVCDIRPEKAKALGVKAEICTDYREIIEDKEIDTVIELIGGYEPARTIILETLNAKKNIVTANKAVIARHGKEIFETAQKNNVSIRFEAAVAGCIPVIRALKESYSAEKIMSIYGILNGTTNYILSRMEEGMSYEEALKKAQYLGFAETDPSFDVEGRDSAQKILILSMLAYDCCLEDEIPTQGITSLRKSDLIYARELGYIIKLLAVSKLVNDELDIRVQPVMIPKAHEMASVNDEINAVYMTGENTKNTMLYGRGAGKLPTATVVVSDVIDTASRKPQNYNFFNSVRLKSQDSISTRYYLRFNLQDKPGVLAKIAKILGDNSISINAAVQKEIDKEIVPVVIITHKAIYKNIKRAMQEIEELDAVKEKPIHLMIEDFR